MLDLAAIKARAADRLAKPATLASVANPANPANQHAAGISQLAALAALAEIEDHRPPVRRTAELIRAINACCDARGDDDANRAGLIAECSALDPAGQADMTEHFQQQAATWLRVTGVAR